MLAALFSPHLRTPSLAVRWFRRWGPFHAVLHLGDGQSSLARRPTAWSPLPSPTLPSSPPLHPLRSLTLLLIIPEHPCTLCALYTCTGRRPSLLQPQFLFFTLQRQLCITYPSAHCIFMCTLHNTLCTPLRPVSHFIYFGVHAIPLRTSHPSCVIGHEKSLKPIFLPSPFPHS